MNRRSAILPLLLLASFTANAAQPATTCDRECLRSKVTQCSMRW